MIFNNTRIEGVYILDIEPIQDERGFFARSWCLEEFSRFGLNTNLKQCNISFNKKAGTIRGIHFQTSPYEETKLVRCTRGIIYDVVVDLREHSESFMQWIGIELTEHNRKSIYIPEGCAHGFQTMEDNTEVFYQMTELYHPECAKGVRWDDKAFSIEWARSVTEVSSKDNNFPPFTGVRRVRR